ncbi:hypothetical protein NDN08_000264 [Rhodosorus marinus]|uniref:Pyridine nucleotide-disulfide oxidoreductase domain-containing protein 2 n=1 Tax=Rhodosorus marinus TaxID=101924 RepID=A0AAV8UIF7_9RHOD|nr:hypothetical protein NDN08_000264 [Rhodosorus marinus]
MAVPRRWASATAAKSKFYDAVVIGAGLNGLVASAYLARAGLKVAIAERRDIVGGTAVTEEVIPGYKFSRGVDVVGLLRPQINADMNLQNRGVKLLKRNPFSLTPLLDGSRYLMLGQDVDFNETQIAQYSRRDAEAYKDFLERMARLVGAVSPVVDEAPVDFFSRGFHAPLAMRDKVDSLLSASKFAFRLSGLGSQSVNLYELFTAPLSRILQREFETEPLCTAIARPALVGSMMAPSMPGTGALLLRHMLGAGNNNRGQWSFVEGGMGKLSQAVAEAATEFGSELMLSHSVSKVLVDDGKAVGVQLENGDDVRSSIVVSSLDPWRTFVDLCPEDSLPDDFVRNIKSLDYSSGVFKLNVALKGLPALKVIPRKDNDVRPEHKCTLYLGADCLEDMDNAFYDASVNVRPSSRPLLVVTMPSAMDPSLAPPGHAVAGIIVQHAPYSSPWSNESFKQQYVKKIFSTIDDYLPGFKELVVGYEALSPHDIERVFGVHHGNMNHCALTVDQMYYLRPAKQFSRYRSPLSQLYICGSGTHPGGGASGASGRNCAQIMLQDIKSRSEGEAVQRGLQNFEAPKK